MMPGGGGKFQVEVDPTEDTEWNDILRDKGIIPPKESDGKEELEEMIDEAIKSNYENRLEGKDLDELEELEGLEDDDFLEMYKNKRINEMKNLQKNNDKLFGQVIEISKPDWNVEITEASEKYTVFVHLKNESILQSRLLSLILRKVSNDYKNIKFVEIESKRAIENYPDNNCPTILIYKNGELIKQLVTLLMLNGNDTKSNDIVKLLVDLKCIDEKVYEKNRELELEEEFNNNNASDDDYDDDDDFFN